MKNRSQACLTSIYNQDLTFNLQGYSARLDPVVCKTRNDFGSYDTQKLKQLEPLPWSDMSKMLTSREFESFIKNKKEFAIVFIMINFLFLITSMNGAIQSMKSLGPM